MPESSATRISLATFSGTSLRRCAGNDVGEILSRVDRDANTFIHCVNAGVTSWTRILDHFALPSSLADNIGNGTAPELVTSPARYLFKKFRFVEERARQEATPLDTAKTGVLIRPAETERLTEGGGSIGLIGRPEANLFVVCESKARRSP